MWGLTLSLPSRTTDTETNQTIERETYEGSTRTVRNVGRALLFFPCSPGSVRPPLWLPRTLCLFAGVFVAVQGLLLPNPMLLYGLGIVRVGIACACAHSTSSTDQCGNFSTARLHVPPRPVDRGRCNGRHKPYAHADHGRCLFSKSPEKTTGGLRFSHGSVH